MKKLTIPRIIGIILLVIGVLSYFAQKNGTVLGIMGIILLVAPKKYCKEMFDMLIGTFNRWREIIITALYDALYWLLVFGAFYLFQWKIQSKAANSASPQITPEAIAGTIATLEGFMTFLVVGLVVLFVFSLLIYVVSRGLIWTTIAKQKPNKKFFLKFLGLNSAWWAIWLPIFFFVTIAIKDPQGMKTTIAALLFVAAYFTPIIHTLFMKKKKVGYSLSNGVAWGIAKVHRFIVPYTFALIIYIILYQAYRLLQHTAFVKPANMLLFVLFIAWLRIYLYEVISKFK